jgi:hypothetical protein
VTSSWFPPGDGLPEVSSFGLHYFKGGLHLQRSAYQPQGYQFQVAGQPINAVHMNMPLSQTSSKQIFSADWFLFFPLM